MIRALISNPKLTKEIFIIYLMSVRRELQKQVRYRVNDPQFTALPQYILKSYQLEVLHQWRSDKHTKY